MCSSKTTRRSSAARARCGDSLPVRSGSRSRQTRSRATLQQVEVLGDRAAHRTSRHGYRSDACERVEHTPPDLPIPHGPEPRRHPHCEQQRPWIPQPCGPERVAGDDSTASFLRGAGARLRMMMRHHVRRVHELPTGRTEVEGDNLFYTSDDESTKEAIRRDERRPTDDNRARGESEDPSRSRHSRVAEWTVFHLLRQWVEQLPGADQRPRPRRARPSVRCRVSRPRVRDSQPPTTNRRRRTRRTECARGPLRCSRAVARCDHDRDLGRAHDAVWFATCYASTARAPKARSKHSMAASRACAQISVGVPSKK